MATKAGAALRDALKDIWKLTRLDKRDFYDVYYFAILGGLVQLILPVSLQSIINFVQAAEYSSSLTVLIVLVIVGTFIYGLVQVKQMQLIEKVQQKIFLRNSFEFADRIPKLDIQKMDDRYLPELTNRFFDTVTLQKGFGKLLVDVPSAIIQIFFGLLLLCFYHPLFIGFGIILTLTLVFTLRVTAVSGMATAMEASDYKYRTVAWLQELARAVKTFKYARASRLHLRENDDNTKGYLKSATEHFKVLMIQYWSLIGFKVLTTAALLIVGAILMVNQQLSIGQFVASEIIIITIIASVEKLIVNFDIFYEVLVATQKLKYITDADVEESGHYQMPEKDAGVTIRLINVDFGYESMPKVLTDINVSVSPGEQLVVMGGSGSGRSSFLRLFSGAWEPEKGKVLIDDIPIKNYDLNSLRNSTGILVSQQAIFHGTLYENISMGNEEITQEDINRLAAKLGLEEFINQTDKGFDTVLDTGGYRLTRITRQRILLLRALVGRRRLLLLEEPFKDLTGELQEKLVDYLRNNTASTTVFTTANAAIARQFRNIILLEEGKIVASGGWENIEPHLPA